MSVSCWTLRSSVSEGRQDDGACSACSLRDQAGGERGVVVVEKEMNTTMTVNSLVWTYSVDYGGLIPRETKLNYYSFPIGTTSCPTIT